MKLIPLLLSPRKRRDFRDEYRKLKWEAEWRAERNRGIRELIDRYTASAEGWDREPAIAYLAGMVDPGGFSIFPGVFGWKHRSDGVEVHTDPECGLPYVVHEGKRLYYPREMTADKVREAYAWARTEQDPASPHLYLEGGFQVPEGAVLFDVGAAEADFTLSWIESIAHAYVFEVLPEWEEPLRRTFAPWPDKVTVIRKFASDADTPETVTLDSLAGALPESTPVFMKLDVEGAEAQVLAGARKVLASPGRPVRAAVCTYHREKDREELTALMLGMGFDVTASQGLMIFGRDGEEPTLRRALIRCSRG